jgi:hypothetical protein
LSKGAKLAYRPVGLIAGIAAGAVSGAIFKQIWKLVANEDDARAAAPRGATAAAPRGALDRAGARGFTKLTGTWPGD